MIKVCHMTSVHKAEDTRIFHKECVSLAKAGYDVYLVERGETYEKSGVHIIGVGMISSNRLRRMTQGAKAVYQAAWKVDADIYHFHDPELLPYGLKLKRRGKKVIFDDHEFVVNTIADKAWLPAPARKLVRYWYESYQNRVCSSLDAVVTVDRRPLNYYKSICRRAISLINTPVISEKPTPPDFESRTIFFAGGVTPSWNHLAILKAMERIPDCRYLLCGPVSDAYLNELKNLPAWDGVDFLGVIPHDRVKDVIASASVGMALLSASNFTYGKEGDLGNTKIFEEMMAGLPVICTDFVRWREFVERWQCGICVDPTNVGEIADAIRYLFDHPDEARKMGENGRRAVEEEFNWAHEEKKLLALYEEVAR